MIVPLIFPMALFLVNSAGLQPSTELPGFPTDSFMAFALAVPFVQGALFSTLNAGTDLARDIQTGFLNRLALTPVRGAALLAGQLAGVALQAAVQAVVYLVVGLAFGASVQAGVAGALVLLVLSFLVSVAFAAIGAVLALRSGSGEAVQGMFPLLFAALFLSSMNMPRNLIEADWFRWIATVNPVSYLIEGLRSLVILGWDWRALALGFGFAGLILVAGIGGSALALRQRLVRT